MKKRVEPYGRKNLATGVQIPIFTNGTTVGPKLLLGRPPPALPGCARRGAPRRELRVFMRPIHFSAGGQPGGALGALRPQVPGEK